MTGARQREQQILTLDSQNNPFQSLVEAMSEGAALVDHDGLIVYASGRLATLLRVPLEQLVGQPFSDWLDEPGRSRFIAQLAAGTSGGHHEHTLQLLDGAAMPVRVGVSLTDEPDGLLRCLTVTDLRPHKALQEHTDRLKAELRVASGTTPGFTAVAAHDLRSPVQSIVGFADVLTKSWARLSEEDRRKFLVIIDRQAQNLSRLIEDVITVSIIDGGGLHRRPELISVGDAISECLEGGGESTAAVSVVCPPDLVVRADREHLGRIMESCLQNAVKYGEPPVRIEAARAGDRVEIRIIDHGPGVPDEFVPQLFRNFSRADTPGTRSTKGIGLGLAIVREFADANGGRTWYEPNTPSGACFVVELPAGDGSGR